MMSENNQGGKNMKKIKEQAVLFLLFFCISLCSCEKDRLPQEKTKQLYLQLSMPESIHVDTKTDPNLGDISVNNVWIVQFKASNDGTCLKALYVPKSGISQSTEPATNLIVNLTTGAAGGSENMTKFTSDNSRFYVIANGGRAMLTNNQDDDQMYTLSADELGELTEAVLKAKTVQIGSVENPIVTTSPTLLTSNPFEYTPEEGGDDEQGGIIKVRAQMFRAFAKVNIKVESVTPGLFTLSEENKIPIVKVYNLPQYMATYRAGGQEGTLYPDISTIVSSASKLIFSPNISIGTRNINSTFFMAENLRGIGKSTTQQGKNLEANGPGTGADKLAGCTRIEVEGTYKYDPTHTDGVKVKYTFYLGGNFTNDYNIARDYFYELTLRIAGPNSADMRVEITDGNVAIFDDVVVIPNITVDF